MIQQLHFGVHTHTKKLKVGNQQIPILIAAFCLTKDKRRKQPEWINNM